MLLDVEERLMTQRNGSETPVPDVADARRDEDVRVLTHEFVDRPVEGSTRKPVRDQHRAGTGAPQRARGVVGRTEPRHRRGVCPPLLLAPEDTDHSVPDLGLFDEEPAQLERLLVRSDDDDVAGALSSAPT